jgi:hypothetical protein
MIVYAPVSVGELVDKITILQLKLAHAQIKQVINSVTHSDIMEEKIHKDYS